ncbi:Receptor-type tyrosine-protein phosphatase F [Chionoecetes opilio]|uniref:Receptor-type tyrosine-protein phosphatase F n=1 Tax=Chionoecetes opilio TaxID=41210 RepID=A0A8J4Y4U7_CHIOP|nr:Receptor-type tyrosine-protein phosphatase F [Chionoecetes opilio]
MAPSWRNAVAVALTLLGFAALCQGTSDFKCYSFLHSGKGTIQPQGDIIIEVGSSYEAYCLFNPAEVNVDDMYFKTSGSDERIPHKVVNNSAIRIEVPANEAASYNLKCLEGNDTFVCQRSVFAGYKPQDVQNFTCLSRNWQNLNCSWSVPENPVTVAYSLMYVIQDYIFEPRYAFLGNGKEYFILSESSVDRWEESPQRFTRKIYNRTISDLYPYVEYEFSVRLHTGTGPIREEMWSKPALVTKRTEATLPTVAPLTTLGMFEVEETKLHREVHVSWQTVNPWEENGPGFTYEVRMFGTDAEGFEIRPKNHEGFPEPDVKSEVIVPEKADLLSVPDYLKVIAYPANDTTTYMVRWRLPGLYRASRIIETITLYWCKQTDYENRCQNKIAWEIIDKPDAHVKNLTGYDPSSRYMFGISVNSNNSSSGIKWSGCIATHGEQQPALKNFNCTYVSATEVKLKWSLDCKAEAAQPSGFNISYCIAEENANKCSGPEMYEGVEGESSVRHTVRNLHPYKHYIFNIASISDLGFGKWTPSIRLQTKPSKPSGPPQHINVVSKGPSWIALVWRPPLESEQNGQIILYDIKWKIKDSQSFSNIQRNTSYTPNILQYNFTHNFTHLDPFTEYHFEVVPCTRVNQESACGTIAADIDVKTKIGAPGKIDSLEYDSPWLKWDHEECNGPSCFYEVHYTVNDTTSTYNTPINHTAILLRDMNISCPANGDIPVRLRAVNTDEEGHHIYGPAREMKITCHSKGSSNIFVLFSISNQYNTNLNLMGVPEAITTSANHQNPRMHSLSNGVESLTRGNIQKSGIPIMLSFKSPSRNNGNHQQPLIHIISEQTPVVDVSNQQLGFNRGNGRQHSQIDDGGNSQNEPYQSTINYNQGQLQENGRWVPFTGQNDMMLQLLHQASQKTRLPIVGENNLHFRLSHTADPAASSVVGSDSFRFQEIGVQRREHGTNDLYANQSANRELSVQSNQSESSISKYRSDDDDSSHKMPCPLLELMKAKGVEVTLNNTDDNFELKIRGQSSKFFKLLQNIDFLMQNYNVGVDTKSASENIFHEEGNDPPARFARLINNPELHQEAFSDSNSHHFSTYRNNETNLTNQDSIHDASLNLSETNEEILQTQTFVNDSSILLPLDYPVNINSSQTDEEQRTPGFVDSMESLSPSIALSPENTSLSPQLENSTNSKAFIRRENRSSLTVNSTEEPTIPGLEESMNSLSNSEKNLDLLPRPAGDDSIHNSAESTVQTNDTAVNAN